ncbi:MAG: MFS transporter [Gemmatimonadales bacterium]
MSALPATRGEMLRRLSVLIATAAVDMLGFAMVLPLLPFYALKLDATPETIGLLIASFSVAQLATAPLWGRVSDRYGRRPALMAGLIASAIAYTVFAFADSVWLLFASRIVQGAGGGTTGVAQAYVADSVGPRDRAQGLGWLSAASSLGVMLGPVVGSLATGLGPEAPGLIAAALCVVNVGFAWRWLPESRPPGEHRPRPTAGVREQIVRIITQPRGAVPRLIWIYGAGMLGFTAMTSVFALFVEGRFGVSEQTIGYFFFYVGLLSLLMRSLLLGPIVRRIGERGAMRTGTILLSVGLAAYPLAGNLWVLAAVMPLIPVGTALLFPATTAMISHATEAADYGTMMGVAQTFAGAARVIAPLFATSAYQRFGDGMPFYLAGLIVAGVGVLAFRLPDHDAERSETPSV